MFCKRKLCDEISLKTDSILVSAREVLGRHGADHTLIQLHTHSFITSPEPTSSGSGTGVELWACSGRELVLVFPSSQSLQSAGQDSLTGLCVRAWLTLWKIRNWQLPGLGPAAASRFGRALGTGWVESFPHMLPLPSQPSGEKSLSSF